MSATIVPMARPEENRAEIDLTIAPDARVGIHRLSVITPLACRSFSRLPFRQTRSFSSRNRTTGWRIQNQAQSPTVLPATLLGTIDRPGDVDLIPVQAKAGQELVLQVVARAIGSKLRPAIELLDTSGTSLAQARPDGAAADPVLAYTARMDGLVTIRVTDADYGGSGGHFYRISAGSIPYVASVFPLGVRAARPRGSRSAARISRG